MKLDPLNAAGVRDDAFETLKEAGRVLKAQWKLVELQRKCMCAEKTKRKCQVASLHVGVSGELEHSEWGLSERTTKKQRCPDVSHASRVKSERGKLACRLGCAKKKATTSC